MCIDDDDLRSEDRWAKRQLARYCAHPDPRDPDHHDQDNDETDADDCCPLN